jgi:hypothetical protein
MPLARHRARHGTVIAVALCLLGCAQARAPALGAAADATACGADRECGSGFCDKGRCAEPEGVYGAACTPAPRTAEGVRDGKLNTCGAYVCIEARCRSCESDAQCQGELGAPRCMSSATRPGSRCGR